MNNGKRECVSARSRDRESSESVSESPMEMECQRNTPPPLYELLPAPESHSIPHVMSIMSLLSSPNHIIYNVFDPIISDHRASLPSSSSSSPSSSSSGFLPACSPLFTLSSHFCSCFNHHHHLKFVYVLPVQFQIWRRWKYKSATGQANNNKKRETDNTTKRINISKTSYNLYRRDATKKNSMRLRRKREKIASGRKNTTKTAKKSGKNLHHRPSA